MAAANTLPQLDIDSETLRLLTSRHAELSRQQRRPDAAFSLAGQALERMPNVLLEGIEWKNDIELAPGGKGETREITTLRGSINLPQAEPRRVLAVFDSFVDSLRLPTGVTVNIRQRPFDIESGSTLRGGDGGEEAAKPRQFVLEIVRKAAP